jgi:phage major head subunit gpT-like protein
MDINMKVLAETYKAWNKVFVDALKSAPVDWQKFATAIPSSTAINVYPFTESIGGMREWIGDRQIEQFKAKKFEVANRDFEKSFAVKRTSFEDDQLGFYQMKVQELASGAGAIWGDLAIEALIGALSGTWTVDGLDFFSVSRVYGESAIVNASTNALTPTNYGTMRALMLAYKGHDGKSLRVMPNLLMVGPALEGMAKKITQNDLIVLSDGASAESNPYKGTAEVVVIPELTGANANVWFLADGSKPFKPVVVQQRRTPAFTAITELTSENVHHAAGIHLCTDARGEAFLPFPHQIACGGL